MEHEKGKQPLPQRWVVILFASLVGGTMTGSSADSSAVGVATALTIAGFLHSVMG